MDIFKKSHSLRFLSVRLMPIALMAIACQTAFLFSQAGYPYQDIYNGTFSSTPLSNGPIDGQWPAVSKSGWESEGDDQKNLNFYQTSAPSTYLEPDFYQASAPSTYYEDIPSYSQSQSFEQYEQPSLPYPLSDSPIVSSFSQSLPTFDAASSAAPQPPLNLSENASVLSSTASPSLSDPLKHPRLNSTIGLTGDHATAAFSKEESDNVQQDGEAEYALKAEDSRKKESAPQKDFSSKPERPKEEASLNPLANNSDEQVLSESYPYPPSVDEDFDEENMISAAPAALQSPRSPPFSAPASQNPDAKQKSGSNEISNLNFNNVAMIEYIRFISRLSNKNFIFDDEDLQFNVTIVSEEPTTVANLMSALLQELQIHDLSLNEQGNNIIIHRNPRVRSPARIVSDGTEQISAHDSELVTRVFRLNTLDPVKASEIIRPLLSENALLEVLKDTNNLILTDLVTNVNKIAQLIGTLDAPNSGITLGQYVVRNAFVDSLVDLANKILQPIAQGNPFVLVPHPVTNSIYIVSNAFIVEKALAILQNLDLNEGRTKILSLETLRPSYTPTGKGSPSKITGGPNTQPGAQGGAAAQGGIERAGGAAGFGGAAGQGGAAGPGGVGGPEGGPGGAAGQGQINPGAPSSFPFAPGGIGAAGAPSLVPVGISAGGAAGAALGTERFPVEGFPMGELRSEGGFPSPNPYGAAFPFGPGGIGTEGYQSAIFDESRDFLPGGVGAASRWARDLPVGHIERTLFFIYKLRYRKGDNIEIALRKIANSLQLTGTANVDLVGAINSSQWIESSNALIFTGTSTALEKVRELILEIDVPLRQVFIEMLILDTTITDSLAYSVDWINRFGGGTTTGEEGFLDPAAGASDQNFLNGIERIQNSGSVPTPPPSTKVGPLPVAQGFLNSGGFVAGVIGTHLTHGGTHFSTIGALVRAIHQDGKANILLNPKIITEDNNPAEIFVGGTDRYKTQSIANDLGSIITNNFQFIDVGTTLRVTPLIGNNGIVTLEIVQETTAPSPGRNTNGSNQDVNLVEVLLKTRTVTKIHVPDGFFVVLSGMIQDSETRTYSRIPCLGGIPIIGGFGKSQTTSDDKRNHMIFIRPLIIDNDEDLEDITRRQQDVYQEKCKFRRSWNYEIDESLNFLNIKPTDPDEIGCNQR